MTDQAVGQTSWQRPATPYEQYCAAQGVPIYRELLGVHDVRELELGPWDRLGGRGAIIDLQGTGGYMGMHLVEVPPGGSLEPERHLYEEICYVVEGRGTTEVWADGGSKQVFEWGKDSVFSPPMNTWHRFINATNEPALILAGTNAPPIMELFRDEEFVFNTGYHFKQRYDASDAYFDAWDELATDELSRRALHSGALVPDAANCYVPPDGQRGSGHKHFFLRMSGNYFRGFIAEYPVGKYSKTHAHDAGPVLVCLAGEGYTLTWPKSAGTTPWRDGKEHLVRRQDYKKGGVVSAAPGGEWFHAHFGVSGDRFRVMALLGGYPARTQGPPGSKVIHVNEDIKQGGNTIEYRDEDPMIRSMFEEALDTVGGKIDMPAELYQ
jgi:quercetin dioxygenase-like cupin family protein